VDLAIVGLLQYSRRAGAKECRTYPSVRLFDSSPNGVGGGGNHGSTSDARGMRRRRPSEPSAPSKPPVRQCVSPRRGSAPCASCALVLLAVTLLCGGSLLASAVVHGRSLTPQGMFAPVNFFFMRLARDLSRVKARRRRFGQENALMPVLLGREEV
jgi:hypothetical protein